MRLPKELLASLAAAALVLPGLWMFWNEELFAFEPKYGRRSARCGSQNEPWPPRGRPFASGSSHECVGEQLGAAHTRCMFRDVCVDGNGTLLYFLGDSTADDRPKPRSLFLDGKGSHRLKMKFIKRAPPVEDEKTRWYPGLTAFWTPFHLYNFGHALDDDFFSVFRLLRTFRAQWDPKVAFVVVGGYTQRCSPENVRSGKLDGQTKQRCQHLFELGALLGTGAWTVNHLPREYNSGSEEKPLFCSRRLAAGLHGLTMWTDTEGLHDEFAEAALCRAAVNPQSPLPNPPKVAIFRKHGRRTLLNPEELAETMRTRLNIQADVIDIANYDLREQMALVQGYSIVVTPPGGISFTSAFLPPGALTVFIGVWDKARNRSFELDGPVFSTRLRVRAIHYPIDERELRLNRTVDGVDEGLLYRNFADTSVDVDKFARFMRTLMDNFDVLSSTGLYRPTSFN